VDLDERNEMMKAKIRDFANEKVPFVLIMGDKESANEAVSVRTRGKGDEGSTPLADFIARAKDLLTHRSPTL
jgi:threonyl-tRNA synthetase